MATSEMVGNAGQALKILLVFFDLVFYIFKLKSDKDECENKSHDCQGGIECINNDGSFDCKTIDIGGECIEGWTLNFSIDPDAAPCLDINEFWVRTTF